MATGEFQELTDSSGGLVFPLSHCSDGYFGASNDAISLSGDVLVFASAIITAVLVVWKVKQIRNETQKKSPRR
jgi:hypothetical protein